MALPIEKIETIKSLCFRIRENCNSLYSDQKEMLEYLEKQLQLFFEETVVGENIRDEIIVILDEVEDIIDNTKQMCKKVDIFANIQENSLIDNN